MHTIHRSLYTLPLHCTTPWQIGYADPKLIFFLNLEFRPQRSRVSNLQTGLCFECFGFTSPRRLKNFTLAPFILCFLYTFLQNIFTVSTTLWVQASYLDESEGSSGRLKFSAKFSAKVRSRHVSHVWWCLECILEYSFFLLASLMLVKVLLTSNYLP